MTKPLFYQTHKAGTDRPWLVLLHGLFGNLDNLAVVRRHFEDRFNILSVDLPDHGQSFHLSHFTLQSCVESLIETLDLLSVGEASLLGHSLGGKVAMLSALIHPERVKQLIVADIAPVTYAPKHQNIFRGLRNVDLANLTRRQEADAEMAEYISEPGVRQFLLKSLYQDDNKIWHWRFNVEGLINNYDEIRQWPSLEKTFVKPTLFIKGGNSSYLDSRYREDVARIFPAAKARVIEDAGHWLHAEKPAEFNKLVEAELTRC
ncbi:alpha/beta fold hydrolase [Alteromonas pelagimontana]|uniref:Alpha/beta fold hydrolase n=1 Tax=Alteromonas pelagimontana TaxID=1858656 RepID=A0A6M4M9S4_9ALTE|nr:alpha/beta fold hydrolase [Alteromonas pelagimontana]QJR79420.1 alpha/beta fold hydrolase [Alteromonas pelagimontana]